jgi:salicylate hydroxylase
LTEKMRVLLSFENDFVAADPVARHRVASRITLRQVLLSGLDDVHMGKTFERYEERGGHIVAHFADGSSAVGDVLVAADGGGSRVRRQFLPYAERIDTGVIGIAGKVFLDVARDRIARPLLDGISLAAGRGGNEPALAGAGNLYENRRSYLIWALSARREKFALGAGAETDAGALAAVASGQMSGWSHAFRDLVGLTDPTTISCLAIRSAVSVSPWRTGHITLLGDAIHSMTPYRGIGRMWRSRMRPAWRGRSVPRSAASATSSRRSTNTRPACWITAFVPCATR